MSTVVGSLVTPWTDKAGWDRFVADSPQGSVFATSGFLDALDRPWEILRLGESDNPPVAAIVFRDEAGEVARGPLPFSQYQGVLVSKAVAQGPSHRRVKETLDDVTTVLEAVRHERRFSWCLHPSFADVRPFSWFNYHTPEQGRCRIEIRYSGLIPLDPLGGMPSVLDRCRSVRRQEYRKASLRFHVAPIVDLDLLDRLHRETFARQEIERPDREVRLLRSIAAAALREGFGEILAAFDEDGRPAGAALFLFDRHTGYYLVAANDPAFRSAGVSTLLLLAGAERGLARGVGHLDVVGMNSPPRGDFKTSFGAEPVPYYQVDWERP